ncbi:MAG: hypothetical protein Q7J47_03365 [Azoarcus sp.]|nr:hypothetical protein [Azoarcus sp.]
MAWTLATLPGSDPAYKIFRAGGKWIVGTESPGLYVSAAMSAFAAAPLPGSATNILAVTSDGTRLYALTYDRLYRSTDGLVGAAWENVGVSTFFPGYYGAFGCYWIGAVGSRLVATYDQWISVSDNAGTTWTVVHVMPSYGSVSYEYRRMSAHGSTIAVANGDPTFALSTDGGDTWTDINPALAVVTSVAVTPTGIAVADGDWRVPRYSTNGGATWADIPGFPGDNYQLGSSGNHAYILRKTYSSPRLYHSTDFVSWTLIDVAGLPISLDDFDAGGGLAVGRRDSTLYVSDAPLDGPAETSPIRLPLRLTVAGITPIRLPLRLQVGGTGSALRMPLRLSVIAAAALSGLDGAGGWPAAPSGQWRPVVLLDGADITATLVGQVSVSHGDNEARTAEFSFRPASTLQPMSLTGRRVQIAFAERAADGAAINVQLMFTGVIDVPSIDMQTRVVSCSCHDQLQEIISKLPRATLAAAIGGRWREEATGVPADEWEYAQARLLSVPASIALDEHQQLRVIPWRGAGLKSITVRDADMLDGSLSASLPSRDELRTRVTCRLQYRYERLRGRGAIAAFSQPLRFYIGDFREHGAGEPGAVYAVKFLTVAMVEGATAGLSGWQLDGALSIDQPAAGAYLQGNVAADGLYLISPTAAVDYALGFSGKYTTRWRQTTTEDYSITVALPSLEADIGIVPEEIGANLEAPFEADGWESDATVLPALDIPTAGDVITPWRPTGYDTAARDELMRTLLDQAWVRLWSASRSGRVNFDLPLRPDLWLDWLPDVETVGLIATGKVAGVEHVMDPDGGNAVTSVSIAVGLPGNADATLPTWALPAVSMPDETRGPEAYSFEIGTFVGGAGDGTPRPAEVGGGDSPPFDSETMIGFSTNLDLAIQPDEFNWYPHQLSIKSPPIDAADRDPLTLESVTVIETTIPTDLLEIL